MKKYTYFSFFLLLGAICLVSCAKESINSSATNTANYQANRISADISFDINDTNYAADRVDSANDQNCGIAAGGCCGSGAALVDMNRLWTSYSKTTQTFQVIRQDAKSNFQITLDAVFDIESISLPYTVTEGMIKMATIDDYVFPVGDAASDYYSRGYGEHATFTITEVNGTEIVGTFSGVLLSENDAILSIENGEIQANLSFQ